MKILFCKISHMNFYKGVTNDTPNQGYGGEFVKDHGYGGEEYNFKPVPFSENDLPVVASDKETGFYPAGEYCLGFVETKNRNGQEQQLRIEKIRGCESFNKNPFVDDVLVVWCATRQKNDTVVVGWYKNATVYRNYEKRESQYFERNEQGRTFNVVAESKNCVLLPADNRSTQDLGIRSGRSTSGISGFGQSMLWYASDPKAANIVSQLKDMVDNYSGENHLYKSAN